MLAPTGKLIVAALLAWLLPVSGSGAGNELRSASNAQFEIVGLDGRSVAYVDELSRHIVEVAGRYLDRRGLQFSQRILVSLKPPEYVDFDGHYSVQFRARGFVNLDVRWESSLDLLTTCRALSEALLVRYSIFNYGQSGPDFLPDWPVAAIGTRAYAALRSVPAASMIQRADLAATPTVLSLLRRRWNDAVTDANGYLLLLAMDRAGLDRRQVRALIGQSIAGHNIAQQLAARVLSNHPEAENPQLDDWWIASCLQLLEPPVEVIETMETSRQWIEALADFSSTEEQDLNLSRLWDLRNEPSTRTIIEARYDIVKLRMTRVNPAYFNAARSLGALFESCLDDARRHKYIFNLSVYLGDIEDGKTVQQQVEAALKPGRP